MKENKRCEIIKEKEDKVENKMNDDKDTLKSDNEEIMEVFKDEHDENKEDKSKEENNTNNPIPKKKKKKKKSQ